MKTLTNSLQAFWYPKSGAVYDEVNDHTLYPTNKFWTGKVSPVFQNSKYQSFTWMARLTLGGLPSTFNRGYIFSLSRYMNLALTVDILTCYVNGLNRLCFDVRENGYSYQLTNLDISSISFNTPLNVYCGLDADSNKLFIEVNNLRNTIPLTINSFYLLDSDDEIGIAQPLYIGTPINADIHYVGYWKRLLFAKEKELLNTGVGYPF